MKLIGGDKANKERSLEQLSGRMHYVDARGNAWGVKSFSLRDSGLFGGLFQAAVAATQSQNPRIMFIAWARLALMCLCVHNPTPGIRIRLRRAAGLSDFSIWKIRRLVAPVPMRTSKDIGRLKAGSLVWKPAPVFDVIIKANLDCEGYIEAVKMMAESGAKDGNEPGGWGEAMSSFFIHKGIAPVDMFGLTIPQLNAINDAVQKESTRRWIESTRKERVSQVSAVAATKPVKKSTKKPRGEN